MNDTEIGESPEKLPDAKTSFSPGVLNEIIRYVGARKAGQETNHGKWVQVGLARKK